MTGDNYNPWPHEAVEALKLLWDQGCSASIIGGRMKKTRNAVIGKVTRLKLPQRASSVKMAKIQARHIRPPKVGHRQTNYNFAFGKVPKERKPPMLEVHVIPTLEEIVPVNGTGITILDLHKEVCHAVVSMPDRRSNELARYCGHEVYEGRYCEGHYVAFHMPLRPR